MKSTLEYLDQAKQRLGIASDYAMAKWLGITTAGISYYRSKKRVIDNYTAIRIADAIGINAIAVIAAAEYEREKNEKRREFWEKLSKSLGACLMIIVVGQDQIPVSGDRASNDIYIMRKRRRQTWRYRHKSSMTIGPLPTRRRRRHATKKNGKISFLQITA